MSGTEEAREAAIVRTAHKLLTGDYPGAFKDRAQGVLEAVYIEARVEGIRQAREAVLANPTWHAGMYGAPDDMYARIAITRAIDALEAGE